MKWSKDSDDILFHLVSILRSVLLHRKFNDLSTKAIDIYCNLIRPFSFLCQLELRFHLFICLLIVRLPLSHVIGVRIKVPLHYAAGLRNFFVNFFGVGVPRLELRDDGGWIEHELLLRSGCLVLKSWGLRRWLCELSRLSNLSRV